MLIKKLFTGASICMMLLAIAATTYGQGGPSQGSITVCIVLMDQSQNVINGSTVPNERFRISGIRPNSASIGSPGRRFRTTQWVTPIQPDDDVLGFSAGNDANCVTHQNLRLDDYFYGRESRPSSGWQRPIYNDEFENPVDDLNSFSEYDRNLFDGDPSNDDQRNTTSDGHIELTQSNPHRTLVVVNQQVAPMPPDPPPAANGGDVACEPDSITLNDPQEGEELETGSDVFIQWQALGCLGDQAKVLFSPTGDEGSFEEIITYENPNVNFHDWNVPMDISTNSAYIRLELIDGNGDILDSDTNGPLTIANEGFSTQPEGDLELIGDPSPRFIPEFGGEVMFYYTIFNRGEADLQNVRLADEFCDNPDLLHGDEDGDEMLDATEDWFYNCGPVDLAGRYENTAIAYAENSAGDTIADEFTTIIIEAQLSPEDPEEEPDTSVPAEDDPDDPKIPTALPDTGKGAMSKVWLTTILSILLIGASGITALHRK